MALIDLQQDIKAERRGEVVEAIIENVQGYFKWLVSGRSKNRHANYEKTVNLANEMLVHSDGADPVDLLEVNRPNEPADMKAYRLDVYQPLTKSEFSKVQNIYTKIYDPRLSNIVYPDPLPGIKPDEGLQPYIEQSTSMVGSFTEYSKQVLLHKVFADPNAVIAVIPSEWDIIDTATYEPQPVIFDSYQVWDIIPGEQYALEDAEKSVISDGHGNTYRTGLILHIVTDKFWLTATQTEGSTPETGTFEFVVRSIYNERPPCRRLGGIITGWGCFESFLQAGVPFWNKATTLHSDLDAAYTMHLYLEREEIAIECSADGCDGGYCEVEGSKTACNTCHGTGSIISEGPMGKRVISAESFSEGMKLPTINYIDKPIEIVSKVEEAREWNLERAMSALHMDVAGGVGENQSGIAKVMDRQEQKTAMAQVANHIHNLTEWYIKTVAWWRYSVLYPDRYIEMLPEITRATDFDILSLSELTNEIGVAKVANVSGSYISGLESDITAKRFGDDSIITKKLHLLQRFDPLPNMTIEDKFTALEAGGITQKLFVQSSNINDIINDLIDEDFEFVNLPKPDQKAKINERVESILISLEKPSPEITETPFS